MAAHLELLKLMEEISEQGYHAGWTSNLEHVLWYIVEADSPAEYGHKHSTAT